MALISEWSAASVLSASTTSESVPVTEEIAKDNEESETVY